MGRPTATRVAVGVTLLIVAVAAAVGLGVAFAADGRDTGPGSFSPSSGTVVVTTSGDATPTTHSPTSTVVDDHDRDDD